MHLSITETTFEKKEIAEQSDSRLKNISLKKTLHLCVNKNKQQK